jgi:hypothetical protein
MPFFPDPRKALSGSVGRGITLTVVPSTTHSSLVSGPIWSFFRISDGIDTCPRFVTLVRILANLTSQTTCSQAILNSVLGQQERLSFAFFVWHKYL